MKIKAGVIIKGLKKEITDILPILDEIYAKYDYYCVITSGVRPKSEGSKHQTGEAVDIRTRHLTLDYRNRIANDIRSELSDDYDIVYHKIHFHIEFDPK